MPPTLPPSPRPDKATRASRMGLPVSRFAILAALPVRGSLIASQDALEHADRVVDRLDRRLLDLHPLVPRLDQVVPGRAELADGVPDLGVVLLVRLALALRVLFLPLAELGLALGLEPRVLGRLRLAALPLRPRPGALGHAVPGDAQPHR